MPQQNRYDFTDAVTRAKAGDQSAFEELYWKSYALLEREAKKFYHTPEDVADALQDVYLRIYEKLDTLQDPKRFLGWAITVCKRTLMNRTEYETRRKGLEDLRPDTSDDTEPGMDLLPAEEYRPDINPDSYVNSAAARDAVREVLEALPEAQQMCLFLWMSGYSYGEIAVELDLPLGTVKSNLNYAKKKSERALRQMQKEGTFDYKAVSGSPMGALLYLLERYVAEAGAVPASAGGLLSTLQASLLAGDSLLASTTATVAKTTAAGGFRAALRKLGEDTGAVVTSLLLVIAVAVGAALGIQQFSADVPVEPQAQTTTLVSRTERETTTEATTAADNTGTGGNETANATNVSPNTVTVPATAAGGTTRAAGANGGNTNPTTAIERPTANAGNENAPLVASLVDVSEVPNAGIINSAGQLGADIADNLTVRDAVIYSEVFYLGDGNETGMYLYLLVKNYLGKDILVQSIPSLEIKSLLGRKLIDQMVRFEPSVSLKSNEEKWFRIVVPYDKLDDITRTQLESNLFQTTYDFAYMEQ